MEIWGGIECSINRVAQKYFDQLAYDHHYCRPELLKSIVGLGIKAIRFPVLWEKNWPDCTKDPVWSVEEHLNLLNHHQIKVIAGLVHHGSGPNYAPIDSDDFAPQLAKYAKMVAVKFPWINDFTPVNEPLTTARFCGLYGLWYPHHKDSKTFLTILINQCKATILAMQAIQEVNPKARLVFTEDLTKIHGTQHLKEQITFENHRRWLSIDLLCGKVNQLHPLWDYIIGQGITYQQLRFFNENPMPPNLLGFNYYVTSERFLDHNLTQYPVSSHGGNGYLAYADVEAVRHPEAHVAGLATLMREAWQRYKLAMAVTEAHLCCEREDQLRWLKSVLEDCRKLNIEGIKVIAITFWALFGAYGWDKLLTVEHGNYETGAFDLRTGKPRATAVAHFIAALSHKKNFPISIINGSGWWEKSRTNDAKMRPILIVSCSELLNSWIAKICMDRNLPAVTMEIRSQKNENVTGQISSAIQRVQPWAIIDIHEFQIKGFETRIDTGLAADSSISMMLAKACFEHQIQFLHFPPGLFVEPSKILSVNNKTALSAKSNLSTNVAQEEQHILRSCPSAIIISKNSFICLGKGPTKIFEELKISNTLSLQEYEAIAKTLVTAIVNESLNLLIDGACRILYLGNEGLPKQDPIIPQTPRKLEQPALGFKVLINS